MCLGRISIKFQQQSRPESPYDQNSSQWILSNFRVHEFIHERDVWCGFIFRPSLQTVVDEDDVVGTPVKLSDASLEFPFPKVFLASDINGIGTIFQTANTGISLARHVLGIRWIDSVPPVELPKLCESPFERLCLLGSKAQPHFFRYRWDSINGRVLELWNCGHD